MPILFTVTLVILLILFALIFFGLMPLIGRMAESWFNWKTKKQKTETEKEEKECE